MLEGQKLGPFEVDKELGAGAMGAVYRGKYVKTGQIVAIKVMAPGLGSTNKSAAARFEREANILKQLKHPHIVRLFGIGKHQNTPYYAMEYIEGESLDKVMARRGRMSWEEVVNLGTQLCDALQHAHEHGIVHRDLKPSNLMILRDGTLKLTDFGIAKDLDSTQLTGANCTLGTAAYMSPEQCRGEANLTYKSDLYSLGIVFYELITGRKPFHAENAMEMFLKHTSEIAERPNRVALEIPVWLDNLICQLMEKKPEHRPMDAAMVLRVLNSIQEKVEAQQSAGIDAVRARGGDIRHQPASSSPTQADRMAARTLLGKKKRKKKKTPLHEQVWVRAVGLSAILLLLFGAIYLLTRPASAEQLFQQAERKMKSGNAEQMQEARDGPISKYLINYGERTDPQTAQIKKWAEDLDAARYEKLLDRHVHHQREKKGLPVDAQNKSEELAFQAAMAESEGERAKAVRLWEQVLDAEGSYGVGIVAKRHLAALSAIDEEMKRLESLRSEVRTNRREPTDLDANRRLAFKAYRMEQLGDWVGARQTWDLLRDDAAKDVAFRGWQLLAEVQSHRLKDALKERPQTEKSRIAALQKTLDNTREDRELPLLDRRLRAHEMVLLYSGEEELADLAKKAQELLTSTDQILGTTSSKP